MLTLLVVDLLCLDHMTERSNCLMQHRANVNELSKAMQVLSVVFLSQRKKELFLVVDTTLQSGKGYNYVYVDSLLNESSAKYLDNSADMFLYTFLIPNVNTFSLVLDCSNH